MENHMLPDKAIKIEEDEQQLTATEEGEQIPEDVSFDFNLLVQVCCIL